MEAEHLNTLIHIGLVTMAALMCGLALIRLHQPAIVGYILAGMALGPTGLKLISNTENVQLLAELGVIMLLFVIGMELSLQGFKTIYKTALSTAVLQIIMAIVTFWVISLFADWTVKRIIVFAFATAVSSTAVGIKILEESKDINTPVGRTTVSVLIAQDLAVIPMLLVIDAFGSESVGSAWLVVIAKLVLSIGFLAFLTMFLSSRKKIVLPFTDWIISKAEVLPLAALAFCFTLTSLSGLLGLSTAYGAFIAGLIIGNSSIRALIHSVIEPIQAVLLMVFFLSIGLLIDINFIISHWQQIFLLLAVATVIKTVVNVAILHFLGEPWDRSFHSGVAIAQIGEFSFVLIAAGLSVGAISNEGYRIMIAVIALSLLISPMWLAISRRLHDFAMGKGL